MLHSFFVYVKPDWDDTQTAIWLCLFQMTWSRNPIFKINQSIFINSRNNFIGSFFVCFAFRVLKGQGWNCQTVKNSLIQCSFYYDAAFHPIMISNITKPNKVLGHVSKVVAMCPAASCHVLLQRNVLRTPPYLPSSWLQGKVVSWAESQLSKHLTITACSGGFPPNLHISRDPSHRQVNTVFTFTSTSDEVLPRQQHFDILPRPLVSIILNYPPQLTAAAFFLMMVSRLSLKVASFLVISVARLNCIV